MVTEVFQRLPRTCRPLRYSIELTPCMKTFKFTGKQTITMEEGTAVLDIDFSGEISDKMVGLYRSIYKADNGEEKVMLATHFEPLVSQIERDGAHVAHLFEDSPKMSSYLVAFAMGEFEYVEATDADNVTIRVYSRPGLVSELGRGEFALDTARRSLPFFGDYFGVRYPLPKLDMLAIPDFAGGAMENWGLVTFRERTLLAEKETASPSSKQGIALTVSHELAHMWFGNLVTMYWWTDLWLKEGFATWIEYLCVNHCFPEMDIWTHFTYGEMASALHLDALANSHPVEVEVTNPDEIDEIFDTISYSKGSSLIRMLHAYLGEKAFRAGLCAYLAKHAYANAATEDLWASLSTASGCEVGELMRPWTRRAGFPTLSVEPKSRIPSNGKLAVQLRQKQYKLPSDLRDASETPCYWPIPVVLHCLSVNNPQKQVIHKLVFSEAEQVVDIPLGPDWENVDCLVMANFEATGLYHVRYSPAELQRITANRANLGWTSPGKYTFVHDGFALAKAGFLPIADWLTVLPALVDGEESYSVWRCVLVDGLAGYIRRMVYEGDLPLDAYHAFLRRIARPALDKLGFLPTTTTATGKLSHDARLLRALLVSVLGAEAGDPEVIAECRRRFEASRLDPTSDVLPGDLRAVVYATVVRHGPLTVIDILMEQYKSEKSPGERSHILGALGSASDSLLSSLDGGDPMNGTGAKSPLQQVLRFCIDPNGPVRDQDRIHGIQACASWSANARRVTWQALKADWPRLSEVYHGQFLLAFLIKGVLSGFAREAEIADVKAFFDKHSVSCPRAVKQVYETMDTNRLLLQRDAQSISTMLTTFMSNNGNGTSVTGA